MSTDEFAPEGQPTEEELRAALEAELRQVRIEQVVTEATVSILNIAVMRSGLVPGNEDVKDMEQVRLGIEAVRGLLPLVEQIAGEQAKPIRDALSQLQLAYVREQEGATAPSAAAGGAPPTPANAPPAPDKQPEEDGPGPAQQSGRLWVPGQ